MHTALVANTFFESVQEYLVGHPLRGPAKTDWLQEDHSFVSNLYSDDLPVPSVTRSFDDTLAAVAVWATDRGERLHRVLGRTNPRQMSEPLLDLHFARNVAAHYREEYRTFAADIPEFTLWANRTQTALDRVMALASPSDVLDAVYVTSNYRLTAAGPTTRLADEGWWSSEIEPQQDVELLIATHLTTADATRTLPAGDRRGGFGQVDADQVLAARLPPREFTVIRVPMHKINPDVEVVTQVEQGCVNSPARRSVARLRGAEREPAVRRRSGRPGPDAADLRYPPELPRRGGQVPAVEAALGHPAAVVVTCRTSSVDQLLIPDGTPIVQLAEFDEAQIGQWVDAWNRANPQRPMALETALAQQDLTRNPFLLSMLAEHVTGEATRQLSGPLSTLELYQQFRTYRGASSQVSAIAALGMFNRCRQTITEDELRADLTALGDHRLDARHRLSAILSGGLRRSPSS